MINLSYEIIGGTPQVSVLNVKGRVDGSNYTELIEHARKLFASGIEHLVLNMEGCDFLSSSGLFALHSIALIAHKIEPPDPETGWSALNEMANDNREFKGKFTIVNVHPNIMRTLNIAGFSSKFDIRSEMQDPLAAFALLKE